MTSAWYCDCHIPDSPPFGRSRRPETRGLMKKLIGFAIVGLVVSVPAHGQRAMTGGGAAPTSAGGIGGGSIGGGAAITFHTLPSVPSAQFQIVDVSGGDVSFFPSSFVNFEQGMAEGEAALALKRKTLAEVAQENRTTERPKAKVTITQDSAGNAVMVRK